MNTRRLMAVAGMVAAISVVVPNAGANDTRGKNCSKVNGFHLIAGGGIRWQKAETKITTIAGKLKGDKVAWEALGVDGKALAVTPIEIALSKVYKLINTKLAVSKFRADFMAKAKKVAVAGERFLGVDWTGATADHPVGNQGPATWTNAIAVNDVENINGYVAPNGPGSATRGMLTTIADFVGNLPEFKVIIGANANADRLLPRNPLDIGTAVGSTPDTIHLLNDEGVWIKGPNGTVHTILSGGVGAPGDIWPAGGLGTQNGGIGAFGAALARRTFLANIVDKALEFVSTQIDIQLNAALKKVGLDGDNYKVEPKPADDGTPSVDYTDTFNLAKVTKAIDKLKIFNKVMVTAADYAAGAVAQNLPTAEVGGVDWAAGAAAGGINNAYGQLVGLAPGAAAAGTENGPDASLRKTVYAFAEKLKSLSSDYKVQYEGADLTSADQIEVMVVAPGTAIVGSTANGDVLLGGDVTVRIPGVPEPVLLIKGKNVAGTDVVVPAVTFGTVIANTARRSLFRFNNVFALPNKAGARFIEALEKVASETTTAKTSSMLKAPKVTADLKEKELGKGVEVADIAQAIKTIPQSKEKGFGEAGVGIGYSFSGLYVGADFGAVFIPLESKSDTTVDGDNENKSEEQSRGKHTYTYDKEVPSGYGFTWFVKNKYSINGKFKLGYDFGGFVPYITVGGQWTQYEQKLVPAAGVDGAKLLRISLSQTAVKEGEKQKYADEHAVNVTADGADKAGKGNAEQTFKKGRFGLLVGGGFLCPINNMFAVGVSYEFSPYRKLEKATIKACNTNLPHNLLIFGGEAETKVREHRIGAYVQVNFGGLG